MAGGGERCLISVLTNEPVAIGGVALRSRRASGRLVGWFETEHIESKQVFFLGGTGSRLDVVNWHYHG